MLPPAPRKSNLFETKSFQAFKNGARRRKPNKRKTIKFTPPYSRPTFKPKRSLATNRPRRIRPLIHVLARNETKNDERLLDPSFRKRTIDQLRQNLEIAKIINSTEPENINVIVKADDRVSKIITNLSCHDIEIAKMIGNLATISGVTDSQMKRGLRLIKTLRKLVRIMFAKKWNKDQRKSTLNNEDMKTMGLLNQISDLALNDLKGFIDDKKSKKCEDNEAKDRPVPMQQGDQSLVKENVFCPFKHEDRKVPVKHEGQKVPAEREVQKVPVRREPKLVSVRCEPKLVPVLCEPKSVPVRCDPKSVSVRRQPKSVPVRREPKSVPVRRERKSVSVKHKIQKMLMRYEDRKAPVRREDRKVPVRGEDRKVPVRGEDRKVPLWRDHLKVSERYGLRLVPVRGEKNDKKRKSLIFG
uniref:Uncharacterized protein n=1 Tax=Strigamia maritima TaxID=126957 RepID=T1JEL7_STRMM